MRRLIFLFLFSICLFVNSASGSATADDNPLRRSFPSPRINAKVRIIGQKDDVSFTSYMYSSDKKHPVKAGFLRVKTRRKIHVLVQGFSSERRDELIAALSDRKDRLDGDGNLLKMNALHSYMMSLLTPDELVAGCRDYSKSNVSFLEMAVERVCRQDKAAGSPKLHGMVSLERDHGVRDTITYTKKNCKFIDINSFVQLMIVGKKRQRKVQEFLANECVKELVTRGLYDAFEALLLVNQPDICAALFINDQ